MLLRGLLVRLGGVCVGRACLACVLMLVLDLLEWRVEWRLV